jgi:hypothetical protein
VFSLPQIKDLFRQYVLLQLYTDWPPENVKPADSGDANKSLLSKRYHTAALPFYVIIKPTAKGFVTVAKYDEGKINSVEHFADFLKKNLPKE